MAYICFSAILAQLVEQLIRNEQVVGSNPMDGSKAPHSGAGLFPVGVYSENSKIGFPSYISKAMSHLPHMHMPAVSLRSTNEQISVGTIYCIGRNYIKHIRELENEVNAEPVLFLKPAASLIVEGREIELPSFSGDVHHETELVLLVGVAGRSISEGDALYHFAGAGIGLDLTARDTQQQLKDKGLPWTISKGFETAACVSEFVPLGDLAPLDALHFTLDVNGERRQEGDTSLMIFGIPRLVAFISGIVTLLPGDLIFTGTPHGVAAIHAGDVLDLALGDAVRASFRVAGRSVA